MIVTEDPLSLRLMLDSLPAMVLVVDGEMRVLDGNQAAAGVMEGGPGAFRLKRTGDAMHCLNSLATPLGCGHSEHCRHCVVRNSVQEALRGSSVVRRRARMELKTESGVSEIFALVTATPITHEGSPRVLLVIDNISDLTDIQAFLPICSVCKKIRPGREGWMPLESYFKSYWDVDFSHSFCPVCKEQELGRLREEFAREIQCVGHEPSGRL